MSDRDGGADPFGVTISARDIYDQVVGIRDDVRTLTQTGVSTTKAIEDHEERLRGIERWKYSVPTAALASIVSAVVAIVKASGS